MHQVMVELQEANKDVLLGKRNVNCLSCGVTDASAANVTVGKDGRVYRASLSRGFQDMTLEFGTEYKNKTGPTRISSANPNKRSAARFPDAVNSAGLAEAPGPFLDGARAQSLGGNQYGNQPQRPYGVSAEVRSKGHPQSRVQNQKSLAVSANDGTTASNASAAHLSQNLSSANMGQNSLTAGNSYQNIGHQRNKNKLPIGFLVQQEKRELHKFGIPLGGKMRPDSAKVTLGSRSRALLAHEI